MKEKKGAFERILNRVKPENKVFVDLGLDISNEIKLILSKHPTIKTQKALAKALNKEESEISRWMSGLHNLTLESISKLSAVLDAEIVMTNTKAKERYAEKEMGNVIHTFCVEPVIRNAVFYVTPISFLPRVVIDNQKIVYSKTLEAQA